MAKIGESRSRVCVLSAHPMVLRQLQRLLTAVNFDTQGQILDVPFSPLTRTLQIPSADLYVLDGEFHGGQAFVRWVKDREPAAQIVVVAEELTEPAAFPLLRLGVKGLVTHQQIKEDLVRAVDAVSTGGYWVPRTLLAHFVDSVLTKNGPQLSFSSLEQLTRRQKEVLNSLVANLSNKEIASALNISERTVKFHVSTLLERFGVRRRADLILICYQESARRESDATEVPVLGSRVH